MCSHSTILWFPIFTEEEIYPKHLSARWLRKSLAVQWLGFPLWMGLRFSPWLRTKRPHKLLGIAKKEKGNLSGSVLYFWYGFILSVLCRILFLSWIWRFVSIHSQDSFPLLCFQYSFSSPPANWLHVRLSYSYLPCLLLLIFSKASLFLYHSVYASVKSETMKDLFHPVFSSPS